MTESVDDDTTSVASTYRYPLSMSRSITPYVEEVVRQPYRVRPANPTVITESDVTLSTLHHQRGAAVGQVTTLTKKVDTTHRLPMKDWALSEIHKSLDQVERYRSRFFDVQGWIYSMYEKDISKEEEEKVIQTFEDKVEELRSQLENMDLNLRVHRELYSVEKSLKRTIASPVTSRTEVLLMEIKAAYNKVVSGTGWIEEDERLETLSDTIAEALLKLTYKVEDCRPTAVIPVAAAVDTGSRAGVTGRGEYRHRIGLPKLEIPVFTGDIHEFPHWWRQFERFVHKEASFDEEDKLAYLRQFCKSPGTIIQDNRGAGPGLYDGYIKDILEEYDRPRLVHRHYTKEILEVSTMKDNSVEQIKKLYATAHNAVLKLTATKQYNVDALLTSHLELRMTPELRTKWKELTYDQRDVPPLKELLAFLKRQESTRDEVDLPTAKASNMKAVRIKTEPAEEPPRQRRGRPYPKQRSNPGYTREVFEVSQAASGRIIPDCTLCKEQHYLNQCPDFLAYDVDKRTEYVRMHKRCFNCLKPGHAATECRSTYKCRTCKQKGHNSLLHKAGNVLSEATVGRAQAAPRSSSTSAIEPTLELLASSPNGQLKIVTALYDTRASISVISKHLVDKLHLKQQPTGVQIILACGERSTRNLKGVSLQLRSLQVPGKEITIEATVVPMIGSGQQRATHKGPWPFLEGLKLADPMFWQGRKIDLLLGTNAIVQIREEGCRRAKTGLIMAEQTTWGWTVTGVTSTPGAPQEEHVSQLTLTTRMMQAQEEGNEILRSFAASEEFPEKQSASIEDEAALAHYASTHKILESGRFQVEVSQKIDHQPLGNSRQQAVRRFAANESSLRRKKKLDAFQQVIDEYFTLGHAERIPEAELNTAPGETYYLPMHAVFKESSTTTKLRVVFDASATTSAGNSLNDILVSGPTLYPMLMDIIIRFRLHSIAVTADISKMFREIELAPKDRDLHRFLWRKNQEEAIVDCRMTRLTFGVTCSPFLATQTLRQISENVETTYPAASKMIKESFYVDDLITGTSTVEKAAELRKEVQKVLETHGLQLRKWRSNSQSVRNTIPAELCERLDEPLPVGDTGYSKTLGVHWNAERDEFHVSISELVLPAIITKRILTSDVAKTFDVLGWLTPTTIIMKMAIQRLWESKVNWDEPVPSEVQQEWAQWRQELPALAARPIGRPYFNTNQRRLTVQLHGFSDASLKAYAGVVYLRATYDDGSTTVALVTAKSRVAPLKGSTIPRLELCGAELLAKLMEYTRSVLNLPQSSVNCWIDSTIVLCWLDGKPRKLKTYVENRVRRSLENVAATRWKHVPGTENPADCASRGVLPSLLTHHPLWWHGPPWLREDPVRTPPQPTRLQDTTEEFTKELKLVGKITVVPEPWLVSRYNSYRKLRRTVAWIIRFVTNLKKKTEVSGVSNISISKEVLVYLSVKDLVKAETRLLLQSQHRSFPTGRLDLWRRHKNLKALNPTLDDQGLVRVNGRLGNTPISYNQRFPVILQGADCLTHLLILQEHLAREHAGPTLVMAGLGQNYFIIRGMEAAKSVCRQCVICKKVRREMETQQMGRLPRARVTPGFPFQTVGTDFVGGYTRKPAYDKTYICVFVCLSTKAVHLETVSDLTTAAFRACLERFIGRRGKPAAIYSDNGSNFRGAANEMEAMFKLMKTDELQDAVNRYCTTEKIEWHFSPARAPHFGGIWEAAVKAFKHHLRRVTHQITLTFEELNTVLIRIEAALNSRPLVPLHAHSAEGLDILTPGHFLVGRPLTALPDGGISGAPGMSLNKRYRLCQELNHQFWIGWSQDYLRQLHARTKWQKPRENIRVGDIVLIRGQSAFRANDWPLAKVTAVYPGEDGLVRAVDVTTGQGTYRRAITELSVLLKDESSTTESPAVSPSPAGMSELGTPPKAAEQDAPPPAVVELETP